MKELIHLPARDLELLSAYLDGELSARDLARLLPRLEREPGLKQALEEMKAVVQQLGSLPEAPLPRSFTLTPETTGLRSRPRVYPVFQFATALAAIVFVALVGLDTFTGQLSMASRAAVMSDAVEEALVVAPEAEVEPGVGETFAQTDDQRDGADVLAEEEVAGVLAPPVVEAPEEPDETLRTEALASPQPMAEKAVEGEAVVGESAIEQPAEPTATEQATPLAADSLNAVAETPDTDAEPPGDVDLAYAQEQTGRWSPAPVPILRVLEIGFGALVLTLGGLTLWIRTKRL
jgi:anti-sigma factor RsiW